MTLPAIAVIGPGAMGAAVAARLVDAGHVVLTSLQGRSDRTRERALAAGMQEASDREIGEAVMLLAIVPPAASALAMDRWLPVLSSSGARCLYVDCNPLAPATKRSLAARARNACVGFADAVLIGLPPGDAAAGTCLYVSGPDTAPLASLAVPGLAIRVVGAEVGAAAALKMCFAAINKGVTGLLTAALLAADEAGAGAALADELGQRLPWAVDRAVSSVPAMYPKAARWVAEMEEIASFLGDDTPAGHIFAALAAFYAERAGADQPTELARLGQHRRRPPAAVS